MKRVAAAGAVVVVAMLGWVGHGILTMNDKLDILATQDSQKVKVMQADPTTVTWKSASGMVVVSMTIKDNETETQFAARLKARVDAMRVLFPEVP